MVEGLPVGLSFIGPPWSEQILLDAGYAFEQLANGRLAPGYKPTLDRGPAADPQ
jgi:amidase